ncbi:MAG: purine-nucleoside phosphorylase [Planctomycetes bacterium]|nr:purine-nucleoside phosphorylase [Planctomycetota bacterium]
MTDLAGKLKESAGFVRSKTQLAPTIGIVLGTGLGGFGDKVDAEIRIPFSEIPHLSGTSVQSHSGDVVFGKIEGTPVVVMEGRLHYYEGFAQADIVYPVQLMKALGCEKLILSNAAGCLNPDYDLGDLMIIEDHINLPGLCGINPLIGPNDEDLGPRFPDMSAPYSRRIIDLAHQAAQELELTLREGVYIMVTGPNLETRAEYRMLRNLGADVVGMSTLPEVVAARHLGLEVTAFSIATDMCIADELEEANIEQIIKTASEAEPKLTALVSKLVGKI